MAYPRHPIVQRTAKMTPVEGVQYERTTNLALRGRNFAPGVIKHKFSFQHVLTPTEYLALVALYAAQPAAGQDFFWSVTGETFTGCRIMKKPEATKVAAKALEVTVEVEQL